jgi:hypothetical protein
MARSKAKPTIGNDNIEIKIGNNARNVAVGKNIKQIIGIDFKDDDLVVEGRGIDGVFRECLN